MPGAASHSAAAAAAALSARSAAGQQLQAGGGAEARGAGDRGWAEAAAGPGRVWPLHLPPLWTNYRAALDTHYSVTREK